MFVLGLGFLAHMDHFGDINEMILDALAAVETGRFRFFYHLLEVAVIGVPEHLGKLAAWPIFCPTGICTPDTLKRRNAVGSR